MRLPKLAILAILVFSPIALHVAPAQQAGDGLEDPPPPPPRPAKQDVKLSAKDIAARRKAYLLRFDKAAAAFMDARLKKPEARKELQGLRQQVLAVSRDRNLTLEMITDRADPARKRVEAMLSLGREDVVKSDPTLAADRSALIGAAAAPAEFESELNNAEDFAATLASLPDRKDRAILQANLEPAKKLDGTEAQGIFVLNVLRARLGVGALAIDLKLCEAARGHSKDMSEFRFFDHVSPISGKEEPTDRAKLAGTTAIAENIYQGGERGEDAIEGWWHSPGHHTNMMAPAKRIGMGRHEGYWTQMFGG
jgi:uncharacterized protein YkwD